jgi:nucleotide-binding universal stress UspA family protein
MKHRALDRLSFRSVDVRDAASAPEDVLRQCTVERDAGGLVIERVGPIDGWSLQSLGRVARRILRDAPSPVLVVPPDLELELDFRGPILAAITPEEHCVAAASMARRLSILLDLPLRLAHVACGPSALAMAPVVAEISYALVMAGGGEMEEGARADVTGWVAEQGLGPYPLRVEESSDVAAKLQEIAQDEGASMIVCGSRQLSLAERILQSSVASDLAGGARSPVLIVPPNPLALAFARIGDCRSALAG